MKKEYIIFLLISLSIFSCDKITESEKFTPGRRDYKWSLDTIPFREFRKEVRITGGAPDDIWILYPYTDTLTHYKDGKFDLLTIPEPFDITTILADGGKLYVGGRNRDIFVYDGARFSKCKMEYKIKTEFSLIFKIWKDKFSNLYAIGISRNEMNFRSSFLRFNGSVWVEDAYSIPENRAENAISGPDGNIFLTYVNSSENMESGTYIYNGQEFRSFSDKVYRISSINNELYFIYNTNIYKYNDGKIYSWKSLPGFSRYIWGRNESDIFFYHYQYGLMHYNGIDSEPLCPSALYADDGLVFENNVIFACHDSNFTRILLKGVCK